MFGLIRAGGFAAAAIVLAASAAFADPSVAGEMDFAPTASPLSAHATAMVDVMPDELAPALPTIPAQDFGLSAPSTSAAPTPAPQPAVAPQPAEKQPSLNALVDTHAAAELTDEELVCLARAVYFESKGEPLEGQLAVAEVIINRSKSGRFPTSLCGVVKQKSQFSFVRGGRIPAAPDNAAWRKAVAIARIAQQDLADSAGSKALFFHARYVRPGWRGLTRVASVGNHIFYR
ncbi:MAG TPA: cell wall hydrolase [Allosphingosinicella sp.]|jgi:spore germination cell wall hydrolase CwlJ-like protein